jgi:hypothetical protein
MKHFEKKLNEFIDSIPPEFHAIHEKAEQLRKEFEIAKGLPETAISLYYFYSDINKLDISSVWAKEITEENYERVHYESKGIKYDGGNHK